MTARNGSACGVEISRAVREPSRSATVSSKAPAPFSRGSLRVRGPHRRRAGAMAALAFARASHGGRWIGPFRGSLTRRGGTSPPLPAEAARPRLPTQRAPTRRLRREMVLRECLLAYAPRETRTPTDHTVHKALNLASCVFAVSVV